METQKQTTLTGRDEVATSPICNTSVDSNSKKRRLECSEIAEVVKSCNDVGSEEKLDYVKCSNNDESKSKDIEMRSESDDQPCSKNHEIKAESSAKLESESPKTTKKDVKPVHNFFGELKWYFLIK